MKSFIAKVVVKLKPTIKDVRGQTLKNAVESLMGVENFVCRIGTCYHLQFDSNNQIEALNLVDKIASELLINEGTEIYEVKSLEEA